MIQTVEGFFDRLVDPTKLRLGIILTGEYSIRHILGLAVGSRRQHNLVRGRPSIRMLISESANPVASR